MLDGEPEVPTLVYIQFTKYFIVTKDVAKKMASLVKIKAPPSFFIFVFCKINCLKWHTLVEIK